jgi:hypothetical protein
MEGDTKAGSSLNLNFDMRPRQAFQLTVTWTAVEYWEPNTQTRICDCHQNKHYIYYFIRRRERTRRRFRDHVLKLLDLDLGLGAEVQNLTWNISRCLSLYQFRSIRQLVDFCNVDRDYIVFSLRLSTYRVTLVYGEPFFGSVLYCSTTHQMSYVQC